jgi:hypothetical protein
MTSNHGNHGYQIELKVEEEGVDGYERLQIRRELPVMFCLKWQTQATVSKEARHRQNIANA